DKDEKRIPAFEGWWDRRKFGGAQGRFGLSREWGHLHETIRHGEGQRYDYGSVVGLDCLGRGAVQNRFNLGCFRRRDCGSDEEEHIIPRRCKVNRQASQMREKGPLGDLPEETSQEAFLPLFIIEIGLQNA